ncbi:hypothetical protein J40TS1_00140 [Paenibacillus montaniterrae]|uniref:RNA helicase n=1 Tax=Paenibacillus montaniterrae TaxID=429341 RepID=A0A919YHB5_9BACL|nr:hypothetical protein [Paenibacillus montaniterrae]GIP14372.1 hypothetical protein J40TS1_00140 [Paenibacillus montaniterrae]
MSKDKQKLKVGLVMPIAAIDGLGADHWLEVKKILIDALDENETYEFETKIVSEGESVGLIHKRIVQGLYTSDIVVCDVSCRNPNVMFELGMRLAFDKPTVIIIDDKTNFTFDAGVIEHLSYPRDLRFNKVVEFKQNLAHKVIATYRDSQKDPDHSPFLKSYGPFTAVKIESTEVSEQGKILEILSDLQTDMRRITSKVTRPAELNETTWDALDRDITRRTQELIKLNIESIDFDDIDRETDILTAIMREEFKTVPPSLIRSIAKKLLFNYKNPNPSDKSLL